MLMGCVILGWPGYRAPIVDIGCTARRAVGNSAAGAEAARGELRADATEAVSGRARGGGPRTR